MDNATSKRLEALKRVEVFGKEHIQDFAENGLGKKLFDSVSSLIVDLESEGANQISSRSSAQNVVSNKSTLREELQDTLSNMNRTAKVMAIEAPEFEAKFRMPRRITDQTLLVAAHAFVQDATPLKERFIEHEMPADFLERLTKLIASFDKAISQKTSAVGSHVAARLTIDEKSGDGLQLIRRLDAIMRNKYHGDPITLAAWMRASHVAKRTRNNGEEEPPINSTDPLAQPKKDSES